MSISQKLNAFIREHGLKHWSFAARKDAEFVAAVEAATGAVADLSFPERVYFAASGISPICQNGNRHKFDSIERGWRFCGRAGVCACARESVSASVKATKAQATPDQTKVTNARRAVTNRERYGVENIGQSDKARATRAAFYADPERTRAAVEKGAATMMEKHGVTNALLLPQVVAARPTIAANLSDEAKASRSRKRKALHESGHYVRLAHARLTRHFKGEGYTWLTPIEEYAGIYGKDGREKFEFRCDACALEFVSRIYDGARPVCPSCYPTIPKWVSDDENAIADFLAALGERVTRPKKTLLGTHEIDIYLPEKGLAIEYGGLYWHSERSSGKDHSYHLNKLELCEARGIRLITIFSDEWVFKRSVVEKRLRHLVGQQPERIAARKTEVRTITGAAASAFFEAHHIQGAGTPPSLAYGLFHDDALVAAMSFGVLRRSNNHRATGGSYELYRFASRGSVVGGASKMFTAFLREHAPQEVVTFADRRWGNGRVYERLGFAFDHHSRPGYWYVERYLLRHYRYRYAKHKLVEEGFDPEKSEAEIMAERGFDRIWDCGTSRFVWRP